VRNDDPRFRRFGTGVDKLFAELLNGDWGPRTGTGAFRPGADVYYDPGEESVTVRLELPGIDPDRITLEIESATLFVSGTRQEQKPRDAVYHQMELSYGRFERVVSLPPEVDASKASADYNDGYLEIKLPVKGKSRTRQIPISPTEEGDGSEES
jgi:HSP20 family protein